MTDAELLEEERKKKEAAATTMATPDSIAGLSINGTPLTPEAITNPQLQFPSAQTAQEVQPQAPVMDMSQENPDFGAMLRSSGIPDSNVVAQVPGIENVRNPGVFDPENIEPARPIMSAGTVERATPFELAGEKLAGAVEGLRGDEIPSINASARGVTRRDVSAPDQVVPAGRFGGQSDARLSDVGLSPVQGRGRITPSSGATQAATEASASQATPSVTPTIETPSGDAQGQVGAVQSPFLQSPDTPSGLGGPLLRGFNMVNDASRPPSAPMGQEATRAALGGRTLNEYLTAPAGTEGVSGLRTDPQGRMIPSGFETRADAFPDYEDQAAAREARLAARPDFGDAVSDRERRAARGEGISMADRTAMAKANARGASPSEIARGNKIADELGVDLRTGQSLQPAGGLTFEQQLALRKEQRAGREEVRSVAEQEREWEQTQGEARQERMDEMNTEIGALTSIIGQAENISGVATEAVRQVGAGTTGFFSPIKWIGGTTAADLAGNLETIKSDAFVANITEMRQNSPTGGAVGNVSDKDLEMLQSLQTSFRQNLKPTTLKKNLKKYKEIRDKVAGDAKAGFIRKYGAKNFNTYFGDKQQGGTQVSPIPNDRESNTQIDLGLQQYFN
jgi:hypothetical protein